MSGKNILTTKTESKVPLLNRIIQVHGKRNPLHVNLLVRTSHKLFVAPELISLEGRLTILVHLIDLALAVVKGSYYITYKDVTLLSKLDQGVYGLHEGQQACHPKRDVRVNQLRQQRSSLPLGCFLESIRKSWIKI
jgi:hypothetical protein